MSRRALMPAMMLAVLVAGCSTIAFEWVRPNTSPQQRAQDLNECRALAQHQAFAETFSYPPFAYRGRYYNRPYFGGPYGGDPFFFQMQREQELGDFCLRARGYVPQQLEPAPR